ncbi:UDP-N-acetyl-D-glucosamine 2-epimerase, UDP-hydrolysing [Photobacterium proteolyticum]|uniref:UDP-N-acetyl-D-glucosamine 2-epimerase, UDP-hydrolysing n=1 Tax=Photobacterium proteolyticum TaxID=1903952 RepID=A0A1Q9GN37_9GAMM|nr:UDP-N-acetylglucosamine 2-epimerase [Photobacterium proteolyticum]OLQ76077.1 UDP-N-acetyl-D-glucosamine 2-epimerase, UDP-hydrolysing [Photobacterium proteolyticum]
MKKLLCVTGSRAEYGIMRRLLLELNKDPNICLSIVATGMHCDPKFGSTYKNIEEDGFTIDKMIPIDIDTSTNSKVLNSMSICQSGFGEYLEFNKFDAILILGDRYEIFSVAIAAAIHNIPLIHLHGGEKTLGNYDEFIRHAITKMSKLHLASTEEYRQRIIQMGEEPSSVYNIGALGAENAAILDLPNTTQLEKKFGSFVKPYFMVVFHPETLTNVSLESQVKEVLAAISEYMPEYDFVFIGSNSDTGSDKITELVSKYCHDNNLRYMTSVSSEEYLALNKYSCGLIGNSSSGLIEIPTLGVATVNIGDRQKGRVRGNSVFDTPCDKNSIIEAIESSLKLESSNINNPYYQKGVLDEALVRISEFLNSKLITLPKDFFDINSNATEGL